MATPVQLPEADRLQGEGHPAGLGLVTGDDDDRVGGIQRPAGAGADAGRG